MCVCVCEFIPNWVMVYKTDYRVAGGGGGVGGGGGGKESLFIGKRIPHALLVHPLADG